MNWTDLAFPLIGVIVGWALTEASTWFRSRREWRQRLNEIKIDTYVEWTAGMEANLFSYARQDGGGSTGYKMPLCEKRLQIVEHDPVLRELIEGISESIPDYGTPEFEDLQISAHSDPEFDWPPFREKMNELIGHVRRDLS